MSIEFEPAKWYAVTVRDDNPECANSGQQFEVNPLYSNAGTATVHVECGLCRQDMTILSATLLDPQPEMS